MLTKRGAAEITGSAGTLAVVAGWGQTKTIELKFFDKGWKNGKSY